MCNSTFNKVRVAFNNAYRQLLGYTRFDSASHMFVSNYIDNFETCIIKNVDLYGLYNVCAKFTMLYMQLQILYHILPPPQVPCGVSGRFIHTILIFICIFILWTFV